MYVIIGKSYYPSSRIIIYIRFELTNKSPTSHPSIAFRKRAESRKITLSEIYFPIRFADLFFSFLFHHPQSLSCNKLSGNCAFGRWLGGGKRGKCSTTRARATPSQSVIYKELFSLKSFRFFLIIKTTHRARRFYRRRR